MKTLHILVTSYEGDICIYSGEDLDTLIKEVISGVGLDPLELPEITTVSELTDLLADCWIDLFHKTHQE